MKNLSKLSLVDKALIVAMIGLAVFVGGWLFGRRDFFAYGYGTCSDVWNPREVVSEYYRKTVNNPVVNDCSKPAQARKEDIIFYGFVTFATLSAAFLGLTYRHSDNQD